MKRGGVILVLTAANLVLLGVVGWQARLLHRQEAFGIARRTSPSEASSLFTSSSSSPVERLLASEVESDAQTGNSGVGGGDSPTTNSQPKFDWRQVESEDYRTYVKNLREIGCPEQTVQDIVAADVRQAFAAKRAEVMAGRYRDFKFWISNSKESVARADLEPKRRAVDEAMGEALRELLGPDVTPPSTAVDWQQAALGQQLAFLPEDKREKTQAVLLRYAGIDAQIRELAWGHGTPENSDERARLLEDYEQKKAGLHALLTPEEYEQVELTASWTADNLRRAMTKFEPTEEEFRQIFREWRAHDENLAVLYGKGEPDPGNRHVFANIEKFLAPERFAKYRETWWK